LEHMGKKYSLAMDNLNEMQKTLQQQTI